MWTLLALTLCAIYPAYAVLLRHETGAIHIHKKATKPPQEEYFPLQEGDVEATERAEVFLKNLLPQLDTTIKKSENKITLDEINADFNLNLYDFLIKGFRKASLDKLAIRNGKSRVDISVSMPALYVDGTVLFNGIIDGKLYVNSGNLSTFLNDVKMTGIFTYKKLQLSSQGNVIQIVDADIQIDISDVMIDFKIIKEPVIFKTMLIQFMNKPIDDIIESVSRTALKLINSELAKYSAETIMEYLIPPKPPLRSSPVYLRRP